MGELKRLGLWVLITIGLAALAIFTLSFMTPDLTANSSGLYSLLAIVFLVIGVGAIISLCGLWTQIDESKGLLKGLFIRKRLKRLMREIEAQCQAFGVPCSARVYEPQRLRYFYTLCNAEATEEIPKEQHLKRSGLVIDLKLDQPCACGECGYQYKLAGIIRKEVEPHIRSIIQAQVGQFCRERDLEPAFRVE